ncbi:hypothetical protein [Piscirickettsia litoralis]|uniref:Uncharacterized protein n=1 Tax=Piscirickettsia litoralis TaxID=1891921 RepID=A0ABX2ZYA5_9GAMM|nr:hypothetical protein [Piscirickettsia litoralis]ODN41592.1 hypothetical protein BGC07_15955 [Piscirickettsia litoralis]
MSNRSYPGDLMVSDEPHVKLDREKFLECIDTLSKAARATPSENKNHLLFFSQLESEDNKASENDYDNGRNF